MIDLRSDTVTRPSATMREAMMQAPVGDDVYGDDPTVNELEEFAADLLGHQASLFLATGTQSNLVALLTHCQRGDEYIVGDQAHMFIAEGGGAAALGGIQPQIVAFGDNGEMPTESVANVIKDASDVHYARSRLLCLENTHNGKVQSLASMQDSMQIARKHNLSLHLDGARMANAAIKLGVTLKQIGSNFDSVSLCLSKGLGAPAGTLLFGDKDFIKEARRWRKMVGGGMRQAGILAAAGRLALTDGVSRLHEDHDNANYLASELQGINGLTVRDGWTQTNMVWIDYADGVGGELVERAKDAGILLSVGNSSGRLVTHCDIKRQDIDELVGFIGAFFKA